MSDGSDISSDEPELYFGRGGAGKRADTDTSIGFHVPGHVRARFFSAQDCVDLINADTTELSSTDDLHNPGDTVMRAAKNASASFGSGFSLFLCSGSTTGIRIMLSAILDKSTCLLLQRSVHFSVPYSLCLNGCSYVFAPVGIAEKTGRSPIGLLTPEVLEGQLTEHPEITDVFITSPDYYGNCADIKALAVVAHQHGCRLLVDEAHGAHFIFGGERFPQPAMLSGADMCAQSLHKTLPALTPAAILHVSEAALIEKKVSPEKIYDMLRVYETSSPSFVIAASAELAISHMNRFGSDSLKKTANAVLALAERIGAISGLETFPSSSKPDGDPLRMVIRTSEANIFAPDLQRALEKRGIFVEFSDPVSLVLLFTIFHEEKDFDKLFSAINDIMAHPDDNDLRRPVNLGAIEELIRKCYARIPDVVRPLREAFLNKAEEDHLHHCVSRPVLLYPPGIPLVWPGERIPQEVFELSELMSGIGVRLSGLPENLEDYRERR
jgi:arginine/lysine/ornithine decarboxylase